jgi:hypothetical protein
MHFGIDKNSLPKVEEFLIKVDSYTARSTSICTLRKSSLDFDPIVIYTDSKRLYYIRKLNREQDEAEIGLLYEKDGKIIELHCLADHLLLVETEKHLFTLSMSDDLSAYRFYSRRVWKKSAASVEQIYTDNGVVYYSTLNKATGERDLFWLNPAGTSFMFNGNDSEVALEFVSLRPEVGSAVTNVSILHLDNASQQFDLASHVSKSSISAVKKSIAVGITLDDSAPLSAHLIGFDVNLPRQLSVQNRFSYHGNIKCDSNSDFLDGQFFEAFSIFIQKKKNTNRIYLAVEKNEKHLIEREIQEEQSFVVTAEIVGGMLTEDEQGRQQVRAVISVGTINNTFKVHILTYTIDTKRVWINTILTSKSHSIEFFSHKWDYFVAAVDDLTNRLTFYCTADGRQENLNKHHLEDLIFYRLVKLSNHLIVFAMTEDDSRLKIMSSNISQPSALESVSLQTSLNMSFYRTFKCRLNLNPADTFSCLFAGDLLHLITYQFNPSTRELVELSRQEYAVYLNMRVEEITLERGFDFFILKCSRAVLEEESDLDDQMAILYYPIVSSGRVGYVLGGMLKSELMRFNISPRFQITLRSRREIVLHEEGRLPLMLAIDTPAVKGRLQSSQVSSQRTWRGTLGS